MQKGKKKWTPKNEHFINIYEIEKGGVGKLQGFYMTHHCLTFVSFYVP